MATKAKKKSKKPSFPRTVTVTQKHIDNSTPGDSNDCAIAVAVREHFESLGFELSDGIEITGAGNQPISLTLNVKFPKAVDSFIGKYDQDEPVAENFETTAKFKAAHKKWESRVKPFSFNF